MKSISDVLKVWMTTSLKINISIPHSTRTYWEKNDQLNVLLKRCSRIKLWKQSYIKIILGQKMNVWHQQTIKKHLKRFLAWKKERKKWPHEPLIVSLLLLICCCIMPTRYQQGTICWLCNKTLIPVTTNTSRLWAVKCTGHNKIDSVINYWAIHNFTREHQDLLLSSYFM